MPAKISLNGRVKACSWHRPSLCTPIVAGSANWRLQAKFPSTWQPGSERSCVGNTLVKTTREVQS